MIQLGLWVMGAGALIIAVAIAIILWRIFDGWI